MYYSYWKTFVFHDCKVCRLDRKARGPPPLPSEGGGERDNKYLITAVITWYLLHCLLLFFKTIKIEQLWKLFVAVL